MKSLGLSVSTAQQAASHTIIRQSFAVQDQWPALMKSHLFVDVRKVVGELVGEGGGLGR